MEKKTIIFIGGSSYSGSTILDMMLGSGNDGFSIGEVYALFNPYRKHHIKPACGCGNRHCVLWDKIKKMGSKNLYIEIFKSYPEVNFIVDSSKNPFWIKEQSINAKDQGFKIKNILIWKHPKAFAVSQLKRGNIRNWERDWINYYRLYLALVDKFICVNYEELVKDPKKIIEKLCKIIGLKYFDGKEFYWNFEHHTLFGNNSAKIHLYNQESTEFYKCADEIKRLNKSYLKKNHQKIYYEFDKLLELPKNIQEGIESNKRIKLIEKFLKMVDIGNFTEKDIEKISTIERKKIEFSPASIFMRKINRKLERIKFNCLCGKPMLGLRAFKF